MSLVKSRVLRFAVNTQSHAPMRELFQGGTPLFFRSESVRMQFGLFAGPEAAANLLDVSNVALAFVSILPNTREGKSGGGTPVLYKEVAAADLNVDLSWNDWITREGQHFEAVFSFAETTVTIGDQGSTFWLAVGVVLDSGERVTLGVGVISVQEDGLHNESPPAPPVGATWLTESQVEALYIRRAELDPVRRGEVILEEGAEGGEVVFAPSFPAGAQIGVEVVFAILTPGGDALGVYPVLSTLTRHGFSFELDGVATAGQRVFWSASLLDKGLPVLGGYPDRVTAGEMVDGDGEELRSFAVADIVAMIEARLPQGVTSEAVLIGAQASDAPGEDGDLAISALYLHVYHGSGWGRLPIETAYAGAEVNEPAANDPGTLGLMQVGVLWFYFYTGSGWGRIPLETGYGDPVAGEPAANDAGVKGDTVTGADYFYAHNGAGWGRMVMETGY